MPVETLGEFSRRLDGFFQRQRGGADADVWVRVSSGEGGAERLINIVSNMEPDYSGSPLRIQNRATGPGVGALGASKARGAEGEELSWGRTKDYTRLLEDDPVDGGEKRFALDVMFKLVAAAFMGASKSASAYLGLSTPSRNPSVTPGAEDTGGNGWGGGFGDVDGSLQLVMNEG